MKITEDENPGRRFPHLTFLFHCLLLILSVCLLSRLAVKELRRNCPRFLKTRNIQMSTIRLSVQEHKDVNHDATIYSRVCNGNLYKCDERVILQAVRSLLEQGPRNPGRLAPNFLSRLFPNLGAAISNFRHFNFLCGTGRNLQMSLLSVIRL